MNLNDWTTISKNILEKPQQWLCQIISAKYRATAYGIMNMVGVFAGAAVTHLLGKWTDGGNLGMGFAVLGGIVIVALVLQLACLRPTSDNVE